MKDTLSQVLYHISLGEDYYRLGLQTNWKGFIPGQFGMLEVPTINGILLRRPFSFAKQEGPITEILYKVVGKGTRALAEVSVGASLKLLGPLGHGFSQVKGSGDRIAVAGGYGIAPFLEMAHQMKKSNQILQLYYGARNNKHLHYIQELNDLNVKLHLATIDGSVGHQGTVLDLLKNYSKTSKSLIVWSCGPMGLLKAVQEWAQAQGVPAELSVEESMGCGTGVCLGCVVKDTQGHYRRACVEGPVFSSKLISI